MPMKATIVKGKGKISCLMPGFHLDEKTRPSVVIEETTEQIEKLVERGLITISEVSDGSVDKHLKKLSVKFTAKARADRLAQLREEKKTGGVSQIKHPDGVTETTIPQGLTPDEVKALADAEIKAIEKNDPSDLNELLGVYTEA